MEYAVNTATTILVFGIAYAMLLFIISVGLSITMGLMGFVNLAHGTFAMVGGYITVKLVNAVGVPYFAALAIAFVAVGLLGVVMEFLLYRRLYNRSELDQVLLTIGIVFASVALVTFIWGNNPQNIQLPSFLQGDLNLGFKRIPTFRAFMILAGAVIAAGLFYGLERTRTGAQIRAAVDNRRMAQSCGINTGRLFTLTFALGSGMAAIGGGLSIQILGGLKPTFAFDYLVLFLIVVAVGGLGNIRGTFFAALLLGIIDFAGKYFLPEGGSFFIYLITFIVLLWRPQGLFGQASHATQAPPSPVETMVRTAEAAARLLSRDHRPRWAEALPWLMAIAVYFAFPGYRLLATVVLVMILFVISLDLLVGYTGIVSLGHTALFGTGAYTAALLANNGWPEPLTAVLAAIVMAAIVGAISGWIILRTHGLTLLMLTMAFSIILYELAKDLDVITIGGQQITLTGGFDGINFSNTPILGLFAFDSVWFTTNYWYALVVLFLGFAVVRTITYSPYGRALIGIRENVDRMHAIGSPVQKRKLAAYVISAAIAGAAGAIWVQVRGNITIAVYEFEAAGAVLIMIILGGPGRLYGAFLGATIYLFLENQTETFLGTDPPYWELIIGIALILTVMFTPGGLIGIGERMSDYWRKRQPFLLAAIVLIIVDGLYRELLPDIYVGNIVNAAWIALLIVFVVSSRSGLIEAAVGAGRASRRAWQRLNLMLRGAPLDESATS
jgi:ABC-type branched-subunit amino acid transport system permease subunit